MLKSISSFFTKIGSYLGGTRVAKYESTLNGQVEVWMIDGNLVLNSRHAVQSFDSMQKVFEEVFKKIQLKNDPPSNVLLLGLAGGCIPAMLSQLDINASIDAVEYDEVMIRIANEHFNISRFSNLSVIHSDAYEYVMKCQKRYDLIIVDLFNDNKVPLQFYDNDFNRALTALLSEKGKITINTIRADKEHINAFDELTEHYRSFNGIRVNTFHLNEVNDVLVAQKTG